jgi:hypothetical protein
VRGGRSRSTTSSPSPASSLHRSRPHRPPPCRICVAALRIQPGRRPRGAPPRTDRGPFTRGGGIGPCSASRRPRPAPNREGGEGGGRGQLELGCGEEVTEGGGWTLIAACHESAATLWPSNPNPPAIGFFLYSERIPLPPPSTLFQGARRSRACRRHRRLQSSGTVWSHVVVDIDPGSADVDIHPGRAAIVVDCNREALPGVTLTLNHTDDFQVGHDLHCRVPKLPTHSCAWITLLCS